MNSKQHSRSFDYILTGLLLVMTFISLIAITGSIPLIPAYHGGIAIVYRQLAWYGVGFLFIFIVWRLDFNFVISISWISYFILTLLLVLLLIHRYTSISIPFVITVNGATAWYSFPSIGSFQPSEFMKIVLIIIMASIVDTHNKTFPKNTLTTDLHLMFKIIALIFFPCVLIYLQPDSGITIIILIATIFVLFSSGINYKWFITIGIAIIILISLLLFIYFTNYEFFVKYIIKESYRLNRIYGWLFPEKFANSYGYHLYHSLLAIGNSWWTGAGFQSFIIPIPEAHTDFIFAVIAQNFGFIASFFTIIIIVLFDLRILFIALKTKVNLYRYLALGIFGILFFQQVQNIAMIIGILPITGITLPFISYGGSSLLSYLICIGMIQMIYASNNAFSTYDDNEFI